mgnify:CR=1 FL=1
MSKTKILFSGLFLAIFMAGNAYAGNIGNVSSLSITPYQNPSSEYQVAKSTFLPDTYDDLGLSGRHNTKYDFNKNDCSAYPLKSCPAHAKCMKCPVGAGYKITSCDQGYTLSNNKCSAFSCSSLNAAYKTQVPLNQICSKFSENSLTCYKDCRNISCAGYTLDCDAIGNAPHVAGVAICEDCKSAAANCSPKLCKISSCEAGYKINAAGTACVEKDDTCPDNYFKTCETGTQGDPKYTEKGTACYQCKPKATEVMKVAVNFAKNCPSGLSFKMTPQGKSAVTCNSSYCYEYDTSGYPYAPDGRHSNETESIVNVGSQVNLSDIPSAVSGIKSVSKNQTYPISGTTYSFNVNDRATVIAGVGQNTSSGLGAYDFWTLQCNSRLAKLGDILYSDRTTSSELISGKTPIGVVVIPGLALALERSPSTMQWGSGDGSSKHNPYLVTCTDPVQCGTSGPKATNNILKYGTENGYSFPAAEYCASYRTSGTNRGEWFLPSISELNSATYSSSHDARRIVNDTLTLVHGQILGDDEAYWTSDEAQPNGAYMLLGASQWKLPFISEESRRARWFSHGKYETAYVRPFIYYASKTPQQRCLDEGYRLQNDWPKPTASNDVVVPSTMLANFMKNIFELKSAMAAPELTTPIKDPDKIDDYIPILPDDQIGSGEAGEIALNYRFEVSATCPYDSNYVKGEWKPNRVLVTCQIANCQTCTSAGTAFERCTKCNTGYILNFNGKCDSGLAPSNPDINLGTGCNGTYRTCNGKKYCCPAGAKTPCDSGYSSQQSSMCFTSIDDKVVDPSL